MISSDRQPCWITWHDVQSGEESFERFLHLAPTPGLDNNKLIGFHSVNRNQKITTHTIISQQTVVQIVLFLKINVVNISSRHLDCCFRFEFIELLFIVSSVI